MRRVGNIYCKIKDRANIEKAIDKASLGKKKRRDVAKVLENKEKYINKICDMLDSESYVPSEYMIKKIVDGSSNKERIIFKPQFFPDQIIHWAIMLQLEDAFRRGMYDYTLASIKNRGIIKGVKYLKKILKADKKNTKYVLKIDISKYYPSIDQKILKSKLTRIIKCEQTLNLLNKIIESTSSGIPIGNYCSQWFANFFLQDFDHFVKEKLKIKYYIRYMDDMVFFSSNKKTLHKVYFEIEKYLNSLNLKIKDNWQVFRLDKRFLDFLGYKFYRNYVTIRRRNFIRISKRIRKISKKDKLEFKDAAAAISYIGWVKHCNSHRFSLKYIRPNISVLKCKNVISEYSRKTLSGI